MICIDRILSEDPRFQLWRVASNSFLNRYGNTIWLAKNNGNACELTTRVDANYDAADDPFYWETDWFELPYGVFKQIEEIEIVSTRGGDDGLDTILGYMLVEVWIDGKYSGSIYSPLSPFFRKTNVLNILDVPAGITTNQSDITMYWTSGAPSSTNIIGWGTRVKFKILYYTNSMRMYNQELLKAIKIKLRPLSQVYADPGWTLREGEL